MATSNVISSVALGKRFLYTDPEFNEVLRRMNRNFQIMGAGAALLFFPALRYLMTKSVDELSSNLKKNFDFLADIFEQHKADFDKENPQDFIDECLVEIANKKAAGDDASAFAENNLLVTILSLFSAGRSVIV